MLDMHSHILPGVDDGSQDEQSTIAMLEMAASSGTTGIVATPHVVDVEGMLKWSSVLSECQHLKTSCLQKEINIAIYAGAEVAINYDLLLYLKKPGPYCINEQNHLLVEFPSTTIPHYTEEFIFSLQTRGFNIILAHPERNATLYRKPEILEDLIRKGVIIQVNGTSLTGGMGQRVMNFAKTLAICGAVHIIGSDAHGTRTRRPRIVEAAKILADLIGPEKTRQIIYDNPTKILRGEEIDTKEVEIDLRAAAARTGKKPIIRELLSFWM